jgi:Rrf2 family protein
MKLQKATSFALLAVLELAADPTRQASAMEIAEKHGISAHHLAKVLRALGRAGIVSSVRGVGGGCRFVGNPRRLTLMDIIVLFEPAGPDRAGRDAPHAGTEAGEALRRVLAEIDEHAAATFRSITLSTMLKLMRQPPAD